MGDKGELSRVLDSFEKPEALEERLEKLLRAHFFWIGSVRRGERREGGGKCFQCRFTRFCQIPSGGSARTKGDYRARIGLTAPFSVYGRSLSKICLLHQALTRARKPTGSLYGRKAQMEPGEIIDSYLGNTPFASFFQALCPLMPFSSRFEHTHIVGGLGHGKTQLLQQMILKDLDKLVRGRVGYCH